jgi:hypothetical protein
MMRRCAAAAVLLVLAAAILLPVDARAQSGEPLANRAYVEFLGAGILYSVNYEVTLSDRAGIRLGVGGLPFRGASYIVALGMPTLLFGRGQHKAVLAGGIALGWIEEVALFETEENFVYGVASLGYQYQPRARGFFMRAAFTPIFAEGNISEWGGLSLGTAF